MRFVELTPDLFRLMPVAAHLAGLKLLNCSEIAITEATRPGRALALLDGGRIVGAAGVLPQWSGRGLCWFIPGLWMERRHYARALCRCRRQLALFRAQGYRRLECTVPVGNGPALRWAHRIGFVAEGRLQAYGPEDGGDHFMMRWEDRP